MRVKHDVKRPEKGDRGEGQTPKKSASPSTPKEFLEAKPAPKLASPATSAAEDDAAAVAVVPTKLTLVGGALSNRAAKAIAKVRKSELFQQMELPLQERVQEFLPGWFQLGTISIMVHWQLGGMASAAKNDPAKYGTAAIEQLSQLLKVGPSVLYADAIICERFDLDEIRELAETFLANGDPIGYSHVRLLARIKDPDERHELLTILTQRSLNVSDFADLIASRTSKGGFIGPKASSAALLKCRKVIQEQVARQKELRATVLKPLEEGGPDAVDPEYGKVVTDAVEAMQNLQLALAEDLKSLAGIHSVIQAAQKAFRDTAKQKLAESAETREGGEFEEAAVDADEFDEESVEDDEVELADDLVDDDYDDEGEYDDEDDD